MADLYSKADELEAYLEALGSGKDAVSQGQNPPPDPEPVNLPEWKTSWRNKVVAGSSFKAAFYGTLTTKPTVTVTKLKALGLTATAASNIIAERDRIRTEALALI